MTKRESGWYRVKITDWHLARYYACTNSWLMLVSKKRWNDSDFTEIDPQMMMTVSGEIVYHNQHDPLYNTKQEG